MEILLFGVTLTLWLSQESKCNSLVTSEEEGVNKTASLSPLICLYQETCLLISALGFSLPSPSCVLSQCSNSQMEPCSLNLSISADLNGHQHCGYGGAIVPENVVSQQHFTNTSRKKSKTRLNDQLLPKPSDINMAEKMIRIAAPKEHPYASHISRFAMFPSFHSPDDPDTGVRAASQSFLNPLVPTGAPAVTLLSKTIGSPYRHEILETPGEKAVKWPGEHGFLNHTKPLRGDGQVFYPTPPKIVLPNPKLRDWNHSLSERASNTLKNTERTLWLTSYQMDYTGSGPANPLKMDDFMEKISDLTGTTAHAAPLKERSYPVFVPSKPRGGWRRRQGRSTSAAVLTNDPPARNQGTVSPTINQQGPQEITAEHNEAPNSNQMGQSQSGYSCGSTEAASTSLSQEAQQAEHKHSAYQGRERENRHVEFSENLMQVSMSESSKEANAAQIANIKKPSDVHSRPFSQGATEVNREESPIELCDEASNKNKYCGLSQPAAAQAGTGSHAELLSRAASEQEKLPGGRELPQSICNPCILPRPPVLPGIRPVGRAGTVRQKSAAISLLEVQDSFSKSEAHRNFNSSNTCAAVNLRENVVKGKKHNFYGINCCYLR